MTISHIVFNTVTKIPFTSQMVDIITSIFYGSVVSDEVVFHTYYRVHYVHYIKFILHRQFFQDYLSYATRRCVFDKGRHPHILWFAIMRGGVFDKGRHPHILWYAIMRGGVRHFPWRCGFSEKVRDLESV